MKCVVAIAFMAAAPRGDVEETLAKAEKTFEGGNARAAIDIVDGLVSDPAFASLDASLAARAWSLRGLAAEVLGDPETAAASLERAFELPAESLDPAAAQAAALSLARSALEMKDGETARRALERLPPEARAKQPAASLSALACLFEGDTRKAEAGFEAELRDGPSEHAAFYLGVIRFDRGEREAALARFEEAARLDPGDYYAWVYRVRALLELDRPQDAAAAIEALEKQDGGFVTAEVHYLLGKARLRQERFNDAVNPLRRAIEMNASYAEAYFGLATALRRLGKVEEAREALEKFQALHRTESERLRKADALSQVSLRNPHDAAAAESLARFSLESGDLDAAEKSAWRAVRIEPGRRDARLVLARTLSRSGRYAAAAIHYQRLLKGNPADAEARAELDDLIEKHAKRAK